jgi:hypothetical protein
MKMNGQLPSATAFPLISFRIEPAPIDFRNLLLLLLLCSS